MKGINIAHLKPNSNWDYEFSLISSYGVDVVRLMLHDFMENFSINQLNSCLSIAGFYGIGVILCMPERSLYPEYRPYNETDNLNHWKKVVNADVTNVIAYEIMNEPNKSGVTDWLTHQDSMIQYLRLFNNLPIIVNSGSGIFKFDNPLPYNNLIYSHHDYLPDAYTHNGIGRDVEEFLYPGFQAYDYLNQTNRTWNKQAIRESLQWIRDFQLEHGVKIIMGEFSVETGTGMSKGDAEFLQDKIDLYDEYGWSWLYWNHRVKEENSDIWDATGYRLSLLKGNWLDKSLHTTH